MTIWRLSRMRIYQLALATSVMALAACSGGDKGASGGSMMKDTTSAPAAAPKDTTAAAAAPAAAAAAAAPITGKTVTVQMIGDAKGYRFEPATITLKVGDGIKFVNQVGGPHNVTFWADSIPAGTAAALGANMPNTTAPLTGPLLITPNDTYTVSFAGTKAGTYKLYCTPHLALGMKGSVTVQ
jgi:plastocyanin